MEMETLTISTETFTLSCEPMTSNIENALKLQFQSESRISGKWHECDMNFLFCCVYTEAKFFNYFRESLVSKINKHIRNEGFKCPIVLW